MTHLQIADYAREAAGLAYDAHRQFDFVPSAQTAADFLAQLKGEESEPAGEATDDSVEAAFDAAYEDVITASRTPYFKFVYNRRIANLERGAQ